MAKRSFYDAGVFCKCLGKPTNSVSRGDQAGVGTVERLIAAFAFMGAGFHQVLWQGDREDCRVVYAITDAAFLSYEADNAVGDFVVLNGLALTESSRLPRHHCCEYLWHRSGG